MDAKQLLDGLDDEQRHAVTIDAAPLAILAPAGSGKTRVLTRRIAYRAATDALDPSHVLAVTFTRKAAGELGTRLRRLGVASTVTAGTFHALALAQLRRWHADAGRTMPQLLERKGRILAEVAKVPRGAAGAAAINELAAEIEWAKARMLRPEDLAEAAAQAKRRLPRPAAEIAEIYRAYEEAKRRRRLIDFDDLLWWCVDLLARDTDFAASQRFRFRHLFVDEFQDASKLQVKLVELWLGTRADLCVVGDDAQAIYSFAGADPRHLQRFAAHFRGGTTVRLGTNYRSTPQIVRAAGSVLGPASGVDRPLPVATRPDGRMPSSHAYVDERAEASGVAQAIIEARGDGVRFSDMAVLYRVNAQSAAFEQAFGAAGIPIRIAGAARFLDRPEVKAVLDDLRESARLVPARPFTDLLTDLDVTSRIAPDDDLEASPPGADRAEHAAAVAALGHEYLAAEGGGGSVAGFLAWLTTALRGDDGPVGGDTVELCTFHRAKGLEWRAVWVTGLERGLVPISHAQSAATMAEERRLLHVALSRAIDDLHLTWAEHRTMGSRSSDRKPSPYLELVVAANRPGPNDRLGDTTRGLERARKALRAGSPDAERADPDLLAALKAWRLAAARAHGVPAFVVFHDSTLTEIASSRPVSLDQLLAMKGIGPTKAERYGREVLDVVARTPTG